MRNLHVPLPNEIYHDLREEASRSMQPATALARHEAIAAFATQYANTEFDLDTDLEAASIEHLTSSNEGNH